MDRSHKLVEYLRSHASVDASDLSDLFAVGERSVRSYVREANAALVGIASIEKRRGGTYELLVTDDDALKTWLADEAAPRAGLQTREERVAYLLDDLLHRIEWITLDDLSKLVYVSKTSLSRDIKDVEKHLSHYGLSIERKPRYGIRVCGPEEARRLCMAGLVVDGLSGGAKTRSRLSRVSACIDRVVDRDGFHVNSAAYQNLVVHIAVALGRISHGCYVPMPEDRLVAIEAGEAFSVAQDLAAEVSREFDVDLPREEVGYIALHLAGRRVLDQDQRPDGGGLVISDKTWAVVDEMLAAVKSVFGFDFADDLELRMNLARHVEPLSIRLTCCMRIENPLLAETRERFPLAYSMASEMAVVLACHYGVAPSEHEIGYLALPLILAMERQRSAPVKKNILVVCASGQGSAKLLEYRYRQEFGRWIDTVTACDAAQVSDIDFRRIDYVFTTVPLGVELPVPVREVGFFLDDTEARDVRRLLQWTRAPAGWIASFFPEDLFFADLDVWTKDEALDRLCAEVSSRRALQGDLRLLVGEREGLAQTSFGNAVAMPHPTRPIATTTFVAVATLRREVDWGGHPVRALFLTCISPGGDERRQAFYGTLARTLRSSELIGRLLETPEYKTLIQILIEAEKMEIGDQP